MYEKKKKYSIDWKHAQTKKHGGWAQYHRNDTRGPWQWHYVQYDTEYKVGRYFSRAECEKAHQAAGITFDPAGF